MISQTEAVLAQSDELWREPARWHGRMMCRISMKPFHAIAMLLAVAAIRPAIAQLDAGGPQEARPSSTSKLDAIIEEPGVRFPVPVPTCAVPGIAARVAQSVGIPAGIEHAPESCSQVPPPAPDAEIVTLTGLTARAALNQLVALDPRYHWVEGDKVVVLRPLTAWADRSHFLHRVAPSFHLDAPNYAAALHTVQSALLNWPLNRDAELLGRRTPQGSAPLAVHLDTAVSVFDALNVIVREHGSLRWRVTYCGGQARHEFATMWLETYDGSGLGSHGAVLRDTDGKPYDACRGIPR